MALDWSLFKKEVLQALLTFVVLTGVFIGANKLIELAVGEPGTRKQDQQTQQKKKE
jgi:hypothetical protein